MPARSTPPITTKPSVPTPATPDQLAERYLNAKYPHPQEGTWRAELHDAFTAGYQVRGGENDDNTLRLWLPATAPPASEPGCHGAGRVGDDRRRGADAHPVG